MIPTADEYLNLDQPISIEETMIRFAKMHVTEALMQALCKMYIETDLKGRIKGVNEDSILNAYPLENIR